MPDPYRDDDFETITLRDLFLFLRSGLIPAAIVGVLAGALAFGIAQITEPEYDAESAVLISNPRADFQTFGLSLVTAPALDLSSYRAAVLSHTVLRRTLEAAGEPAATPDAVDSFRNRVTLQFQEGNNSSTATFTVRDPNPERAARLSNALAETLVAWDAERATDNLDRIVATLESQIDALDAQIAALRQNEDAFTPDQLTGRVNLRAEQQEQLYYARTLSTSAMGLLRILEPALVPRTPAVPRPLLTTALAGVLGVFVVYGILLVRTAIDTRLRSSDDVARASKLPVLAEFPKLPEGVRALPREAVGYLRTNLLFDLADAEPKVIMISSASQEEGKTSVASSLAVSLARDGHRTLVIDADLRKPVMAEVFGVTPGAGPSLRDWLSRREAALEPVALHIDEETSLDLIPTFEAAPSPSELLGYGFRSVLDRVRNDYDVIVIDTAPVLPVADSLTIAPHCTATVLAVSASDTTRTSLQATIQLLERIGVRLAGTVTTRMPRKSFASAGGAREDYGYGYGYGAGYGRTHAGTTSSAKRTGNASA